MDSFLIWSLESVDWGLATPFTILELEWNSLLILDHLSTQPTAIYFLPLENWTKV